MKEGQGIHGVKGYDMTSWDYNIILCHKLIDSVDSRW